MIRIQNKKIGKYIMLTNKKVVQLKHSSIFLGLNTQNKKKVLIKVISKDEYQTNDILKNSLDFQLKAMNDIKQENILKAIQLVMTQKNYYLILEEPKGVSLKKFTQKNGTLKQKQLRSLLKKARSPFYNLFKNQIIHGNINSKSVLINHNKITLGYLSYVKTVQILKTNYIQGNRFTITEMSEKQNEYCYLPPELLAAGLISLKQDIWSLGVLIYQTLTGDLPWSFKNCSTPLQMASEILNTKILFPKIIQISKQMKHLILNCLQVDPTKRFGWEQILEHSVFKYDSNVFQQSQNSEEFVCSEQTQSCHWSYIQKIAKTNFTLRQ